MKSMTGYGSASARHGCARAEVVVQSVNRKHLDIQTTLPPEWAALESRVHEAVAHRVSRGRVQVQAVLAGADENGPATVMARIDHDAARAIVSELRSLREELGLAGEIDVPSLLAIPGVLRAEGGRPDAADAKAALDAALDAALGELAAMREREGAALRRDLAARLAALQRTVAEIEARRGDVLRRHHEAMHQRLAALGAPLDMNDDRLLREIALFADRSDIAEETTRLASHLAQAEAALDATTPVGRTLEFLVQEILREINTIGSKANDAGLSGLVVGAKSEIDRIREQVQNIE